MMKIKAIILSLISIFWGQGYAANLNPVTVEQVHAIVSDLATYTAGLGVKIVNNVVSQTPSLSIGDFYQGGVIFYIDATGRHGLSVSLNNLSSAPYLSGCGQGVCPLVGASANGIGAGRANSTLMIASQMNIDSTASPNAAQQAASLYVKAATGKNDGDLCTPDQTAPTNCLGDWYIPSMNEFSLLAEQMNAGTLDKALQEYGGSVLNSPHAYWQSTETSSVAADNAYGVQYHPGETPVLQLDTEDKSEVNNVRAIRQF